MQQNAPVKVQAAFVQKYTTASTASLFFQKLKY